MIRIANLPFKISDSGFVILKNLPVFQYDGFSEYLLEDSMVAHIEEIFETVNSEPELEKIILQLHLRNKNAIHHFLFIRAVCPPRVY